MSTRVRYVVKSPDGAYRGEHRGAAIGFGWVTDPLAAAFMSKPDATESATTAAGAEDVSS